MDITDDQHWDQIVYILCSQRWRSSIQSAKTRLCADHGSDHELFIAKFGLKLKKVGETTRPFRYDLNKIPYDYTVEGRNRFKGLDLIGRVHVCSVCPTLWDPMHCSPPGSSVHEISQARILEWVAISSSKWSSWRRYWTHISQSSALVGRFLITEPPRKLRSLK